MRESALTRLFWWLSVMCVLGFVGTVFGAIWAHGKVQTQLGGSALAFFFLGLVSIGTYVGLQM